MKLSLSVIGAVLVSIVLCSWSYAETEAKGSAESQVENSTSHNPLTKTTTQTFVKKAKRKYRTEGGVDNAEENLKIQKKTADDGKKTSVTTEETQSHELDK